MKNKLYVVSFLLFFSTAIFAESYELSPDDAVNIALKNNLELKTSEINLKTKLRNKKRLSCFTNN